MKRNFFTRVMKSLFILLFVMGIGEVGWGQTILNFPLTSNNQPTTYSTGNSGCRISTVNTGTVTYGTTNGAQASGWDGGSGTKCWLTSTFNSTDLKTLTVNFFIRSAAGAPRDFSLQYSLNNSTWTPISSITATNTLTQTSNIALPEACSNQPNLYLRIIMTSNTPISGTGSVTNTAISYLKGFTVNGVSPSRPGGQAANITFIAITPTTIKVGCSPGNGDHRIIVMNTSESFTNPADNSIQPAISPYTSGETVVYNGTGNTFTVTVPSSSNNYVFRVFEYNYNDGMTRYLADPANDNPRQCLLESIINPSFSAVRLTTAILGGQITTDQSGTISERGIYWSEAQGVTSNDNNVFEQTDANGVFALDVSELPRSSTIYFIAYVINASGTSYTSESSFTNTPIFTGTNNWDNAGSWNVQQVPGSGFTYGDATDNPTINGICTLNSNTAVNDLIINSSRSITINPAKSLTVGGTLTNNGGTAGLKLLSTAAGTGSLIHNTPNVDATVQRYITGGKVTVPGPPIKQIPLYHQVSVPLSSQENYPSPGNYESSIWEHSYLFTYDAAINNWDNWDYQTNDPCPFNKGYLIYHPDWKPGTSQPDTIYIMKGKLNTGTYSPPVINGGNGYNLIPNPYPSSINWNASSGWSFNAMSNAIWLYKATENNYATVIRTGDGSIANGTLTSSAIQVGQAFFVKAIGSSPTVSMNDDVRIHNSAQGFLKNSDAIANSLRLNIEGNSSADEILVNFSSDATTGYDSQYDAEKFTGPETSPQLSALNVSSDKYSIIGLPLSSDETVLPLNLNMNYSGELTFTASQLESFITETSIKLEDKQLAKTIDLRSTPTYSFTHTPDDADDRFVLHFGSVLGFDDNHALLTSSVTVNGKQISVSYPITSNKEHLSASIFDTQGRLLKQVSLNGTGNDSFTLSETSGVYLLRLTLPSGNETHKIVVL